MGVVLKPFRASVLESWASFQEYRLAETPGNISVKHVKWHEQAIGKENVADYRFIGWDISSGNPEICSTCKIHYSPKSGVVVMTNLTETIPNGKTVDSRIGCISRANTGVYLITTNGYEDMPASAFTARERVAKASIEVLLQRHQDRMKTIDNAWIALSDDEIAAALSMLHTNNYEYFRSIGFYGPIEETA